LYTLLATQEFSAQIDWARVHLFWSDERAVPPDHPDSNFKMANDALISRVPIPAENVHRIRAEIAPEDAASEYEQALSGFFSLAREAEWGGRGEGIPAFDLILLGLGPDAHTASLFPHTPLLRETGRWVAAQYVEQLKTNRISFTPPLINAAKNILFLVAGADKADAVHAVLRGTHRPADFPAQLVQPTNGRVVWLLDEEASQELKA
jgi:6-phosphogluconolactonase